MEVNPPAAYRHRPPGSRKNHTGLNGTGTTYAGMKVDALTALPHRMRPDSEDFGKNIRIL
uniref:Uncharacterized protein n=1 Tax=Faecalibaculum rodentium TaxID=1702221 RepID=A0A140DRV7_9FIRM|nr:hypothetical protein AALO17_02500 [Faecalibaculum rodentium]